MKFKYEAFPVKKTIIFPQKIKNCRPIIRITLQKAKKSVDIYALVDSGADYCVFPDEIGKAIGIDVESGRKDTAIGVSNNLIEIYFHKITLIIDKYKFKVWVGFSKVLKMPLLGRSGFFEEFKVKFDYRKNEVGITPYRDK